MKNIIKVLFSLVTLLVIALPAFSQRAGSSSRDSGSSSSSSISTPSSSSSPGASTGSRDVSTSRDGSWGSSYIPGASGSSSRGLPYVSVPKLQGTSFVSANSYYAWYNFYDYLQLRYMMNALYFTRFYRNVEPLVTPQLLKLTMREPLRLSMQMMTAVDDLESMLEALQAGKPVSKQEIADKAQEIRELARMIRKDQALSFVDQRKDKDVLKGNNIENQGLQAISQLREMVTDLNTQLKSMYTQNTTSTISVSSLTQPSFESLSKGIERLSRVIENSAKKI